MRHFLMLLLISSLIACCNQQHPRTEAAAMVDGETVVLVHGMGRTRASLLVLSKRLKDAGYQTVNFPATIKSGSFGGQFALKIDYCPFQPTLAVQFVGWEDLSQGNGQQPAFARDSGCLRDLLPGRSQPWPRSKAE